MHCVYYSMTKDSFQAEARSNNGKVKPIGLAMQSCTCLEVISQLVGWSVGQSVGQSVSRSVGRSVGQLVGRSISSRSICYLPNTAPLSSEAEFLVMLLHIMLYCSYTDKLLKFTGNFMMSFYVIKIFKQCHFD